MNEFPTRQMFRWSGKDRIVWTAPIEEPGVVRSGYLFYRLRKGEVQFKPIRDGSWQDLSREDEAHPHALVAIKFFWPDKEKA